MKLDYRENPVTLDRIYTLTISEHEWPNMHRYGDQPLIDDCSGPEATVADTLLGLQQIAFRIEQEAGVR